jgi:CubicO group peptidase (beta-lactamase class C family)
MDEINLLPPQPAEVAFPTDHWPEGPPVESVDREKLRELTEAAFAEQDNFGETHALLAVHRGRLVFERYGDGYGHDETYRSWSMAKSVTHALIGLLIRDGKLSLEGPAPVPSWESGDPRHEITLEHLLRMQDGLNFVEEYVPGVGSDVIPMLFQEGKDDVAAFAEARPLAHPPGTHWNYSSGTSNIVAAIAGRAIGGGAAETRAYLERELLHPIGMRSATPRFDAAGTFIGSSYLFASARDFARFGLFYLRDGVWEGGRILPEGWVDHARTTTPGSDGEYGAHWWLRLVGEDSFHCSGFQGQYTVCVPSRDLVVVRLGVSTPEHRELVRVWLNQFVDLFD